MKIQPKLMAVLTALLMISNNSPMSIVKADSLSEETITAQDNALMSDETSSQDPTAAAIEEPDISIPDEEPMFNASIEYSFQGYVVKGTFTEFPPDISLVQPLYSLDGENYQVCGENWDLRWLGGDANALAKLQNQICLYSGQEPLKSYLTEELDRFYMKLRLTRKNGITYETRAALIDRGIPQQIPEGITPAAKFAPNMIVRETGAFSYYGRYQLTVNENATPEDVSSFLPDTLPIEIQLQKGIDFVTKGIVNCPVTWKPLSLPRLISGESITISDAAEEIVIPGGTLLSTPTGVFRLDGPLGIDQYAITDEVRLVLNVVAENAEPTGVLSAEHAGLEMSFHLKPTGATAIRAYTFSKGSSEWVELPDLPLLNAINAQPSTANSGYTLILDNACEPYHSYRAAEAAGSNPEPFFVGLKIEGGVYNGRQLILTWPDTYELPPNLPEIGGAGGNEGNAGADNKDDSTTEGQRPNLPQEPENNSDMSKNRLFHDDSDHINQQNREDRHPRQSDTPVRPLLIAAAAIKSDMSTEEKYPPAVLTVNKETSVPAKITLQDTLPAKAKVYTASVSSENKKEKTDKSEKSERNAEPGNPEPFLPVRVIAVAVAGICIAAVAGKITVNNISGRITRKNSKRTDA